MLLKKKIVIIAIIIITSILLVFIWLTSTRGNNTAQPISEVLRVDEQGQPVVVRVRLTEGLPVKIKAFDNWVYLIRGNKGVVIWDSGSRYPILTLIPSALISLKNAIKIKDLVRPGFDISEFISGIDSSLRCENKKLKPLINADVILKTLNNYFPGEKVSFIGLSHWHWDHSENAPFLQKELKSSIRIHQADRYNPGNNAGQTGWVEKVFKETCFEPSDWQFGEDLTDSEELDGANFKIIHTPGHTPGFVSLASDRYRMVITGPSYLSCFSRQDDNAENCKTLKEYSDYDIYLLHPGFDKLSEQGNVNRVWLNNDVAIIKNSTWFMQHHYGDCPQAANFWPRLLVDCLIPEGFTGPSATDKKITPEPEGLYYKHFTPGDFFQLQNSERSVDSLLLGIEKTEKGEILRSVSLMVHPRWENGIVDKIGLEKRAEVFYKPYIEEAIGNKVNLSDVVELYRAALKDCPGKGIGLKKDFGKYLAVVQKWQETKDCNIHIVSGEFVGQ